MAADFLHQLIEQAYAAAQASPATVTQLESKLRRVQDDRRCYARESMMDADSAALGRRQRVAAASGGTLTPG